MTLRAVLRASGTLIAAAAICSNLDDFDPGVCAAGELTRSDELGGM